MNKTICELFAGVGGFRLGFERLNSNWETVWFNQWEPSSKNQWAYDCYVNHFGDCLDLNGESHTNDNINNIDKDSIPDHTLLVAGFPCQDYSVAHSLSSAEGIEGKKGVLWWDIYKTLVVKRPPFCLFENVDRLLKSPASGRGRDFGIILSCLLSLNYSVEWRVVNAADYGAGQKRKRVFIFAYQNDTNYFRYIQKFKPKDILEDDGFMAKSFPVDIIEDISEINISMDFYDISQNFKFDFKEVGFASDKTIYTATVESIKEQPILLGDILESNVDEKYYIKDKKRLEQFEYLKSSKRIIRKAKNGHEYVYSEGAMSFPDLLDKPGRTILTSEGTLNRSTHVIEDSKGFRILTPREAERLNGFDDDWTNTGMSNRMRYFCMGNALVVPMITRMGRILTNIIEDED